MRKYKQGVIDYLKSFGFKITGDTVVYVTKNVLFREFGKVKVEDFVCCIYFPFDSWNENIEIDNIEITEIEELYSTLNKLPQIEILLRKQKMTKIIESI